MIHYQLSIISHQWEMDIEHCELMPLRFLLETVLSDELKE